MPPRRRKTAPEPTSVDWKQLAADHADAGPADCLCEPCCVRWDAAHPKTEWQKYLAGYSSSYDSRPWNINGPNQEE